MDAQSFLEDNQNNESDMDLEETLALKSRKAHPEYG